MPFRKSTFSKTGLLIPLYSLYILLGYSPNQALPSIVIMVGTALQLCTTNAVSSYFLRDQLFTPLYNNPDNSLVRNFKWKQCGDSGVHKLSFNQQSQRNFLSFCLLILDWLTGYTQHFNHTSIIYISAREEIPDSN